LAKIKFKDEKEPYQLQKHQGTESEDHRVIAPIRVMNVFYSCELRVVFS